MPRHKKNRSADRNATYSRAANRFWSLETVGLALILLTTFVIYFPALHGGRVWDDDVNITRPELRSLHGLYRIWFDPVATAGESQYYPFVHTAFWLEYKLWGDAYEGYHLINVLWHSIAVLLVYVIVKKLQIPGALLAAAIFAVHPVMVESVAWMTEQKNTLSTVLYLSAMLLYLNFDESRLRSRYFVALGLFAMALLAKTATVTFPFALLVLAWWKRGTLSWRRDVLPLVPFFALSIATGLMTVWVETKLVGAEGSEFELTFLQRFLLAGRDVWFYLGKLIWPTNLSFTYTRWNIDPSQWWQWTFSIAALAMTFAVWSIRNRWRGPLAAWLFFCGSLFPILGFVNVFMFRFTFVADHLQYLPSLGMIVLASAGIATGLQASVHLWRSGVLLCLTWLITLAALSFQQSAMYADIVTLYRTTLELNPGSWMAHNNLGLELASQGKTDEAISHYQLSLSLNPKSISARNNLARVLTDMGQLPEAITLLSDALAISPNDPVVLNSLGLALIHSNRLPEAREHLERALAIKPGYSECHINMGIALALTGHLTEAIVHFRTAANLNPNDAIAENNWGIFLGRSGRLEEALQHFIQANKLQPNRADIVCNIADALRQTGRPAEAIEQYRSALRLNPNYVQARAGLAQGFALTGRSNDAIATAKQAIEIARTSGQSPAAEYVEKWLKSYQSELAGAKLAPSSP